MQENKLARNYRIDLLKAIAISLVLISHLRPIQIVQPTTPNFLPKLLDFVVNKFYTQVSIIAVPIFLLISFYLLFQKLKYSSNREYLLKRCQRLAEIFIFWTGCQFIVYYIISFIEFLKNGSQFLLIPKMSFLNLLMHGGPPLPLVGDSVFYFLFVLLMLTLITSIIYLNKSIKSVSYILALATVIISLIYFEFLNISGNRIPYWRIDNFLIYVPIAYFFSTKKVSSMTKFIPFLWVAFIIFLIQDHFLGGFLKLGIYSRLSVIFGAVALFSTVLLHFRFSSGLAIIIFLSKFSLGIFALHKYWQWVALEIASTLYPTLKIPVMIAGLPINLPTVLTALIVITTTLISTYFLSKTPLIKFVT